MPFDDKINITEDGPNSVLKVLDKCYGAFFMGMALVTGIAFYRQQTSGWGLTAQILFPAINLLLSQITFRLKSPARLEVSRFLLNLLVLAPLTFLLVDGALDQYWAAFVLLAMGSSTVVTSVSSSVNYGRATVIALVAMMFVSALVSAKEVNWYIFAMHAAETLMLGVFITQIMAVLMKSLKSQNEQMKELKQSQKIILEQQQIMVMSSKMSALGEMAGGVAHEINTPLAVIGMRVQQMEESLKEGASEEADLAGGLATIRKTVDRIAKVISGLKFFARDGRGASAQKVRVSELIEETLSFCSERFQSHGVRLEVMRTAAHPAAEIECRSVEISQVLLNLLNNAYDALEGGKDKWIRVEVSGRGESVEISVTDSGSGIPEALQDKVMQPFFTTKAIGKGTGLGLSISRGIMEAHGGKLSLDKGSPNTKFVISIPKETPGKTGRASRPSLGFPMPALKEAAHA